MIQEELFICGERLLSHPVSFLFHLDDGVAKGAPSAEALAQKRLAIIDCRVAMATDVAGWIRNVLALKKPALLLCPGADTLAALRGVVGILPVEPGAALLISSSENQSGLTGFHVHALNYTCPDSRTNSADGPSALATQRNAPVKPQAGFECACTDFATLASTFVHPVAADNFKVQVEKAMEPRVAPKLANGTPPTGLKWFWTTFTSTSPFTYSQGGTSNNSAGVATFTWTVWGFLSQSAQANSQFLVVEGRISVNAGALHSNDECDRGFGNAYVQGTLNVPMSPQAFVPTSGQGTFRGDVSIPISYKSPLGGYQIWNYAGSVNNTVDSWACKSISSGSNLGAQWWMTQPCDGSNVPDKWRDAFTTWGHVNDFSGASSGSLDVNSISAWYTKTLLTGYQWVTGNFGWEGARFWGSSCSPGMYWGINAGWNWIFNSNPGFTVDFTPINP